MNIRRKTRRRRRAGTSTVEFALVVPVMMTFTFGLIEMSRLNMVKESLTQATREGARIGIRPDATVDQVETRVNEELTILGITNSTITVDPDPLGVASGDDQVTVEITVPISAVSYVPGFFDFDALNLTAQTTMRRESTD